MSSEGDYEKTLLFNFNFYWVRNVNRNSSKLSATFQTNLDVAAHSQMAYHSRTRISKCCHRCFKTFFQLLQSKLIKAKEESEVQCILGEYSYFVFV